MSEPPRTFNEAMANLHTSWAHLAEVLWAGYKEFLLKIGECIVKAMDWMNE